MSQSPVGCDRNGCGVEPSEGTKELFPWQHPREEPQSLHPRQGPAGAAVPGEQLRAGPLGTRQERAWADNINID